MSTRSEYTESTPNVKVVRDAEGRRWLCEAGISADTAPNSQVRIPEEDVIYDRMFGG